MTIPFAPGRARTWERRNAAVGAALPYVLLAISMALSLAEPGPGPYDRQVTVGLTAAAAVWVLVMFSWMDSRWRRRTLGRLLYVGGLLAIGGILVAHSSYFIAFAVTCFVQSLTLLPPVFAVIGVAFSSAIVFLVPTGFHFHTAQEAFNDGLVIALETLVVGGLSVLGLRAREENVRLQAQLVTEARRAGILDERGRMAREIHDTLAQGLTGIVTQLEAAQKAGELSPHVEQARALARESLSEARRSVQALRPAPLEESRLPEAIGKMARLWSESSCVPLTITVTGEPRPLMPELEVTLFRAAQEALANVAKHAHASKVGLTLSYMEDVVLLDVRDEGAGFDTTKIDGASAAHGGNQFGLVAMAQRLRQVGGQLEVESVPGSGTAINARVPAISSELGA